MDPGYRWSHGGGPASPMAPPSDGASPRMFNSTPSPFGGNNMPYTVSPGTPNSVGQQPPFYRMLSNSGSHPKSSPEPAPITRQDSTPSPYDNLSRSPERPADHWSPPPLAPAPQGGPAPPPPPPPPPMPGAMPTWKEKQEEAKRLSGADPNQQMGSLPSALQGALSKDKKPFTYTPGGLDLSEIRSPRIQRRIQANRQTESAEPELPPAPVVQRQMTRPEVPNNNGYDQVARQIEGLNLAGSKNRAPPPPAPPPPEFGTGSLPRHFVTRQPSTEQPKNFVQSKSFKILQKVVGTDKDQGEIDNQVPVQSPRVEEDEMRFRGLRRSGEHVPSRSFQALQRMTGPPDAAPYATPQQQQYPLSPPPQYLKQQQAFLQQRNQAPYFNHNPQQQQQQQRQYVPPQTISNNNYGQPQLMKQGSHDYGYGDQPGVQEDDGPVDIRYTGGNIPSRSFRILQEMTGEDPMQAPSAWSSQQQQVPVRKVSRVQQQRDHAPSPPPPKQFPMPEVPASQQALEAEPRKYSGARIPSHSFRILQAMTGDTNPYRDDEEGTDF